MNTQYFVLYVPSGWSMRELPSDKTYRGEITNGTTVLTLTCKDVNTLPYEDNPLYYKHENIGIPHKDSHALLVAHPNYRRILQKEF